MLPLLVVAALSAATGHAAVSARSPTLEGLGWKERAFSGKTDYSIVEVDGGVVIRGEASGTASALYRKARVDLRTSPFIAWRWRVANTLDNRYEREKRGDDFPARVYVVYRNGPFPWNALAINYVWSSHHDVGEHWKSAYTDRSHVVVLRSGTGQIGSWVRERRDVAEDFRTFFGVETEEIHGFAIMVDGDDTGGSATAWFADVRFGGD